MEFVECVGREDLPESSRARIRLIQLAHAHATWLESRLSQQEPQSHYFFSESWHLCNYES
jgi:hypothetical protein